MASAVGLRGDFDGAGLVRLARLSGHANQVRRLLALAVIYDGGARHEAARVGGVGLQTVRDWVLRFNAQGPDGHCQTNQNLVHDGPETQISGFVEGEQIGTSGALDHEFMPSISSSNHIGVDRR